MPAEIPQNLYENPGLIANFALSPSSYIEATGFPRQMKTKDIIANIRDRLSIGQLNGMQQQMARTESRDIILLAPTGSGKTIAFAIPLLRNIDSTDGSGRISAVVIAPSRELVIQISEVIRSIASGLKVTPLYGGHPINDETASLSVVPDIVIATPGRLLDHLNRSTLDIAGVKSIVLDEYDKSLELGFLDEMRKIIKRIRRPSLKILTSATELPELPDFINGKNSDFETFDYSGSIDSPRNATTVVEVPCPVKDKLDTLTDLLHAIDNQKTIVFVNHRESAERVHQRLKKEHFPAGLYHGGLEQNERKLAIDMLDNGSTPILVATDLASRGIDINGIGSVIHYHLPPSEQAWIHRNGRTARMGASGTVYVIVSDNDSIGEYIRFDRSYTPGKLSSDPIRSQTATLYFNAGKKEKISKGDIVGYLIQKGGLAKEEIGAISIGDHHAIAAVPAAKAEETAGLLAPHKLKNKRVRVLVISR